MNQSFQNKLLLLCFSIFFVGCLSPVTIGQEVQVEWKKVYQDQGRDLNFGDISLAKDTGGLYAGIETKENQKRVLYLTSIDHKNGSIKDRTKFAELPLTNAEQDAFYDEPSYIKCMQYMPEQDVIFVALQEENDQDWPSLYKLKPDGTVVNKLNVLGEKTFHIRDLIRIEPNRIALVGGEDSRVIVKDVNGKTIWLKNYDQALSQDVYLEQGIHAKDWIILSGIIEGLGMILVKVQKSDGVIIKQVKPDTRSFPGLFRMSMVDENRFAITMDKVSENKDKREGQIHLYNTGLNHILTKAIFKRSRVAGRIPIIIHNNSILLAEYQLENAMNIHLLDFQGRSIDRFETQIGISDLMSVGQFKQVGNRIYFFLQSTYPVENHIKYLKKNRKLQKTITGYRLKITE